LGGAQHELRKATFIAMFELNVETRFSAAHRLRDYGGKCERLHGHNWRVVVRLGSEGLNELGMVMDFQEVKKLLEGVICRLDHGYLNEVPPFDELNPTTEHIARHIAGELARGLRPGVSVRSVTCWESEGCGATYTPDG